MTVTIFISDDLVHLFFFMSWDINIRLWGCFMRTPSPSQRKALSSIRWIWPTGIFFSIPSGIVHTSKEYTTSLVAQEHHWENTNAGSQTGRIHHWLCLQRSCRWDINQPQPIWSLTMVKTSQLSHGWIIYLSALCNKKNRLEIYPLAPQTIWQYVVLSNCTLSRRTLSSSSTTRWRTVGGLLLALLASAL